jgi:hypothetical protein
MRVFAGWRGKLDLQYPWMLHILTSHDAFLAVPHRRNGLRDYLKSPTMLNLIRSAFGEAVISYQRSHVLKYCLKKKSPGRATASVSLRGPAMYPSPSVILERSY